jgi:hypothetical protein
MYILVREAVPIGTALVGVAHASLACYLKFRDTPEVDEWLAGPFRKAICRVSDEDFDRAKQFTDYVIITESQLGGAEIALAFKPRAVWDKAFQFFRLYR